MLHPQWATLSLFRHVPFPTPTALSADGVSDVGDLDILFCVIIAAELKN